MRASPGWRGTSIPRETESDEFFRNAGEKGVERFDPADPPRRRANKRRGRVTWANDRPPVLGMIGRRSDQVRLRVVKDTKGPTVQVHVHRFTPAKTQVYTDEYDSYNGGYVAIHEFRVNLKVASVEFIALLVGLHSFYR